jgi:hypothetical protein
VRASLTFLPLALLAAAPARADDTVADKVFGAGLMTNVTSPEALRYRYELSGVTMAKPYDAPVTVDVRQVAPEGDKKIWFDMFEGQNHRAFGPMDSREQNPLVIVFLQRDVTEMGNLTGGSSLYFQQQIRQAFNGPAEVSPLDVEVDGRKVQATRIVIHPFRGDPQIERFPKFRDKAYEFVVTPEVPGGLYRIATSTPDPKGEVVLAESMTFERADRTAADAGEAK